jgi:addiction module HigA family antidote
MIKRLTSLVPGNLIKEELKARKWTQDYLAEQLKTNRKEVNNLLRGQIQIDSVLAEKLASIFGTSAIFWLNVENSYQKSKLEKGQ